jgi:ribulose-phosphate 3-epimerase
MKKILLAPSLLNADFSDLRRSISYIEETADMIHLDIMDGNFVPNITFGPLLVKAVRSITRLPLDVHLMIAHPVEFIEDFYRAGADWMTFHAEVTRHLGEAIGIIKNYGMKAGVALSPQTPTTSLEGYLEIMDYVLIMSVMPGFGGQEMMPETLGKIGEVKRMTRGLGKEVLVEVDGGVKTSNLREVVSAGADIVVVGSSIFTQPDPRKAARQVREMLDR